jgi:hypothetical protein
LFVLAGKLVGVELVPLLLITASTIFLYSVYSLPVNVVAVTLTIPEPVPAEYDVTVTDSISEEDLNIKIDLSKI